MYTRIDVVGDAKKRAESRAFDDRMRYQKFIEAAEHFAVKNGLIVGGESATRLLLGPTDVPDPPTLDSFFYGFYSNRAPSNGRALGDALYELDPDGLGHYTTVLTKVTDYLLAVAVDGRDLFTITSLPRHRGVKTADVVIPSSRPAQFAKDNDGNPLQLLCMGPEIQLMNIYADICNPGNAGDWLELLETEEKLRQLFFREIKAKITLAVKRATGGSHETTNRLIHALQEKYITGPGKVVIGPLAIALIAGKEPAANDRLQVVTAQSLEDEARKIAAVALTVGVEVQWTLNDPKIPTDARMRRLTVYAQTGKRRTPVLDVYNAANYEAVPFITLGQLRKPSNVLGSGSDVIVTGGRDRRNRNSPRRFKAPAELKIGTPFTLMRFRLADMWTIQILMQMDAIGPEYANRILLDMLDGYDIVAKHYTNISPELLLPKSSYIGRLEDSALALKRAAQNTRGRRFHPPYLPAQRKSVKK